MTRQLKNKMRALVLLTVFSLNTVAGFACSVGVNMGYNTHHHAHGEKHSHKQEHQHNHFTDFSAKFTDGNPKDDCCSNDVTKFSLLDKSVAANNLHLEAPVFLLSFTTTFLSQSINESGLTVNSRFQFVRRSTFLNDTDIRIAIQSFQI